MLLNLSRKTLAPCQGSVLRLHGQAIPFALIPGHEIAVTVQIQPITLWDKGSLREYGFAFLKQRLISVGMIQRQSATVPTVAFAAGHRTAQRPLQPGEDIGTHFRKLPCQAQNVYKIIVLLRRYTAAKAPGTSAPPGNFREFFFADLPGKEGKVLIHRFFQLFHFGKIHTGKGPVAAGGIWRIQIGIDNPSTDFLSPSLVDVL